MILIISHAADDHTQAVLRRLGAGGHEAVLFDLADFPGKEVIALGYGGGAPTRLELVRGGRAADLARATACWWRRPQHFRLDEGLAPHLATFTYNECHEAIAGLWNAIDAPWMNPPHRDEVAAKKSGQLAVARSVGLDVPRTLITNDPGRAREFVRELGVGRVIFKAFSAQENAWRETRVLREAELECIGQVRLAPVIFQEFVPLEADLRVTVVGNTIFPAAIRTGAGAYEADTRMELARAEFRPAKLPRALSRRLLDLMDRLGIVYGAIDLRRTPEGRYVFFEINPAGQWLFVEERTGQPITEAVAKYLARPRRVPRSKS